MSKPDWVSLVAAAKLLGVSRNAVLRMTRRGVISTREYPGEYPTYSRADIERLRDESVRPAGSVTAG